MKKLLVSAVCLAALGLFAARAEDSAAATKEDGAAAAKEAQMEKIGALSGRLTLKFQQTLPIVISNSEGEGGAPNYQAIEKLYYAAMAKPQKVIQDENSKQPEMRGQEKIDDANQTIQRLNELWGKFTQEEWKDINAKINACNGMVGSLNQVFVNSILNSQNHWIASGVDLDIMIRILEVLDNRAEEIRIQAETGHVAQWRGILAAWNHLAE